MNTKNFQMRSASLDDRSPSPKYCPKNGIFCNTLAMPSSGSQPGAVMSELTFLPAAPAVYSSRLSSWTIDGKIAASPRVTSARYRPLIRSAGMPTRNPSAKHAGITTTSVASHGQCWSSTSHAAR